MFTNSILFFNGQTKNRGQKDRKKPRKKGRKNQNQRKKKSAHVDQTTLVSCVDVSFRRINLFPPLSREKKKKLAAF